MALLVDTLSPQNAQIFLAGIVTYYTLIYVLHRFMLSISQDFYGSLLRQFGTRKTLGLLVFIIGVLVTLASTPFCGSAFLYSPSIGQSYSPVGPSTLDGKICIGTRAVLWTAELPLLGDTHFYLVHHILSLASLSIVLLKKLDLFPIYLIYAGLITEVFSSSRAFIRGTGLYHSHPKLFAVITSSNAVSIILFRGAPAIYLLQNNLLRPALTDNLGLAYFFAVAFYGCFLSFIAYKLLASLGYVSFQSAKPAHFTLQSKRQTRKISVYSLLLGIAMASAELSSASLYELVSSKTLSQNELANLASIGLGTVISGIVGAKAMNRILSVPGKAKAEKQRQIESLELMSPRQARRFFPGFKGISIQGAILFSAIWLCMCPALGLKVNNQLLLGAAGLSLPLGEAIGRIGCYFAACCGSTRREKYPAIQLLAATLNLVIFFSRTMFLASHGSSKIWEASITAVLANSAVRLVLNPLRSDAAEVLLNPASMFAFAQFLSASSMLVLEKAEGGLISAASILAAIGVASKCMLMCRIATLVWEIAAMQLQKWKLSRFARLENFVYAFSAAIFILVTNSSAGEEVARVGRLFLQKQPLLVMSNPSLLGSVAVAAALPIVLLN